MQVVRRRWYKQEWFGAAASLTAAARKRPGRRECRGPSIESAAPPQQRSRLRRCAAGGGGLLCEGRLTEKGALQRRGEGTALSNTSTQIIEAEGAIVLFSYFEPLLQREPMR